jgi:hypothetical protein
MSNILTNKSRGIVIYLIKAEINKMTDLIAIHRKDCGCDGQCLITWNKRASDAKLALKELLK